jgi:hypothetical protein
MHIEDRLAALEKRLRNAEDHLAILNLLVSYGPLVDSGWSEEAPRLWADGGGYNYGLPGGGTNRLSKDMLHTMYESDGHMGLVNAGVSHFTGTPKITINGDSASAVGYSFVILREGEGWSVWRAAINEWSLARGHDGWRITERFNRTLDGSRESHDVMRRIAAI